MYKIKKVHNPVSKVLYYFPKRILFHIMVNDFQCHIYDEVIKEENTFISVYNIHVRNMIIKLFICYVELHITMSNVIICMLVLES